MNALGRPARFDRSSQHRRSMYAKVRIAQKTLKLSEDDYRAVMLRVTGRLSAKDCTDRELELLLAEFEAKGFTSSSRPNGPRPADHPAARKARALWISLHQLGAINDPSEKGLEAMAHRALGCDRLQWANQAQVYKLIEALKAIAERHGWSQSTEAVKPGAILLVLKRRLVEAIIAKMRTIGMIPADWSIERAGFELAGAERIPLISQTSEETDRLSEDLGAKLRAFKEHGR